MKIGNYRVTHKGKVLIVSFLLGSLSLIAGLTTKIFYENRKWSSLIYPGVTVEDIDLTGKNIAEAKKLIESKYVDSLLNKKITVNYKDKSYTLDAADLNIEYNLDETISKAFNYGKDTSIFNKMRILKEGSPVKYNIQLNYDENCLMNFAKSLEGYINKSPSNASVRAVSHNDIVIADSLNGNKLQREKLISLLKDSLNSSEGNVIIQAPVEVLMPSITTDMVKSIDTMVSSYSTSYASSNASRANNIRLAAERINGKLIMPGETFSFNKTVGERTEKRGFMKAPVIIGNKLEDDLGGGICQVSSTLYNAVLDAGLNITERRHHSLPSAYVPLGLDATVDWNNIDFKFQNTLNYPILLEAYTENKKLHVNIFSNSKLLEKNYKITSSIYEVVPANIESISDTVLDTGKTVVLQEGRKGYKVRVVRNIYENVKLVKSEIISEDYYEPVPKIVRVGVKQNDSFIWK